MASMHDIRQLQIEAGLSGDADMAEICEQALDGDEDAYRKCERAISGALAMLGPEHR